MKKFVISGLFASLLLLSCSSDNSIYEFHYETVDFPNVKTEFLLYGVGGELFLEFSLLNISEKNYCVPTIYSWKDAHDYSFVYAKNNIGKEIKTGEINFAISGIWTSYFVVSPQSAENIKSHRLIPIRKSELPVELEFSVLILPCDYLQKSKGISFKKIVNAGNVDWGLANDIYVISRKLSIDAPKPTDNLRNQNTATQF